MRPVCDIRQRKFPECKECKNKEEREQNSSDGICCIKSELDALPLRYIELCSGPGRCSTRDGWEQDGTALAILNHPDYENIADAIFIDYNQDVVDTLNQRIQNLSISNAKAYLGDYNNPQSILAAMRSRRFDGLTLCLVDPTDCSVPFDTIQTIYNESNQKCDFIISFFRKTDFHRNCIEATTNSNFQEAREKYQRFLGNSHFFTRSDVRDAAEFSHRDRISELFRKDYAGSLKRMGLIYQDTVGIDNIYNLLFATSNPRGLDFWNKARKYAPNGQGTLF
ncbi:MAG: three-Cys-motif partner protein TcmP [Planctomycetia bacterium]|nr:three-Cys-motif partner protein TcmP [Planctomycetia bacterium]